MLASVTMCNDDIRNYNSKISDLGYLTIVTYEQATDAQIYNSIYHHVALKKNRIETQTKRLCRINHHIKVYSDNQGTKDYWTHNICYSEFF